MPVFRSRDTGQFRARPIRHLATDHFEVQCPLCHVVIAECLCEDGQKKVTYFPCRACQLRMVAKEA
jgi:hypothetical protein